MREPSEQTGPSEHSDREARHRDAVGSAADAAEAGEDGTRPADSALLRASRGLGVTAGATVLFLALRLLAVAEWNWETAGAIADTFDFTDLIPVAFGTLFARPDLTGALIALLLPLAVLGAVWPLSGRPFAASSLLLLTTLVAASASLVASFGLWWPLVAAALLTASLVTMRLVWRHGVGRRTVVVLTRSTSAVAVGGLLVLAAIVDTPWMSHERLDLADGALSGYVLEVEPGFVRVLTDERELVIVPVSEIRARTLDDAGA